MIEDELESIEEKLSKEGVKLSNIIKRISNDYSSLEQRDQEIVQSTGSRAKYTIFGRYIMTLGDRMLSRILR